MERLLKKNGLDNTRHQLKQSQLLLKELSISESHFSHKKELDQSLMSNKRNFIESVICQKNQQNSQKNRPEALQKIQEKQATAFNRTEKPFLKHAQISKSGPKQSSNVHSGGKSTIQTHQIEIQSPSIANKNSLSSKKYGIQTLTLPKRIDLQQNIQEKQKQNKKIQEIISFLRQKLLMKCTLQNHERNKILYVCLGQNCQSRIGCSYCFLHNHENHLKSQIVTCIKDLEELSFKINANQQLFSSKVKKFYSEFTEKLDFQIENIRSEFETNLSFVKMYLSSQFRKVQNQFEFYFKEKYLPYLKKQNKNDSYFFIDSNFKDDSKSSHRVKNLFQTQRKKPTSNNLVKEKELLENLAGLKFEEIYSYLLKRSEILHLQSSESKVLLQFFQEMNSSLTKLFSAFKRNLPKIFTERIFLQKPLIISSY